MGGWDWEKIKYEGHGRNISKMYIIKMLKCRLQLTRVASMVFREVNTLEES